MLPYSNRVVEFPRRYQVIKVPGTDDIYDFVPVPGHIIDAGRAMNKEFFDSIQTDLNNLLPKSSKATQAEAEAGTNNTKYMTPLRVSQLLNAGRGVKYTGINLIEDEVLTTIDLNQYINENVRKLEIIINAIFHDYKDSYQPILLKGSTIRVGDGGDYGTSTDSRSIGATSLTDTLRVVSCGLLIEIYNDSHYYRASGHIDSSTSGSSADIEEIGTFNSLSELVVGPRYHSSGQGYSRNFPTQIGIYQYMK